MNKKEARLQALENRKKKDQSWASSVVLDAFLSSKVLESFTHIGLYYPIGKEIDVMPLLNIYKDKKFYLPVTKEEIDFLPYDSTTPLVHGPFHTKEPVGDAVNRDLIECFIIPCFAIGKNNARIGYGKGYYDRYLKDYKGLKIGIVYEDAVYDIEGDFFDIKLDIVLKG